MGKKIHLTQQDLKERINAVFARAINAHHTHEQIVDNLSKCLYSESGWSRLTHYQLGQLRGHIDARFDELYRHYVTWGIFWNGKLYFEGDDKSEVDWLDVYENAYRGFFWKGSTDVFGMSNPLQENK